MQIILLFHTKPLKLSLDCWKALDTLTVFCGFYNYMDEFDKRGDYILPYIGVITG